MNLKPGLYIVSTPIGNLQDITLRALETLKSSDIVLCEDTRVSAKLLAKHQIKAKLLVYNDNSDENLRKYIKTLIDNGKVVSLISDAGTPLISDPGYKLVRNLKEQNIYIDVIPGVCAVICALTISGLPTNQFFFAGFIPKTDITRRKFFKNLVNQESTIIFYEAANRLIDSLKIAFEIFGNRKSNVARELTKIHQESRLAYIEEQIIYYQANLPKGEIVLSIEGVKKEQIAEDLLIEELSKLIKQGLTAKAATEFLFDKHGKQLSKKNIYQLANRIKCLK